MSLINKWFGGEEAGFYETIAKGDVRYGRHREEHIVPLTSQRQPYIPPA